MNFNEELEEEIYEESQVANSIILGFILGLIIPMIAIIFFNYSVNKNLTIPEFYYSMQEKGVMSSILSLTGIPNLLMFFVFIKYKKMKSVKGIMISTLILAVVVFVVKFSV